MNEVMINEVKLPVKELNGQRMVTFKDIDMVHGRVEGTASRNFKTNKKHFIEGVDYWICKKSDFLKDEIRPLGIMQNDIPNRGLTLLSESGYLMIVKSFNDELSWEVQRDLVNSYFKLKEISYDISEELPVNMQSLNQIVTQLTNSFQTMVNHMDNMYESRFEEFKRVIENMAQKSLPVIKDKTKENTVKLKDPIRDTIRPLAELYNDKSVGYNNTYRKVYAAMDVDWKYRKTRYKNSKGNKNRPSKIYLLESDAKLLSKFSNTVEKLIVEATQGNK